MAKRLDVGALLGAAVSDSNPMQVHDIPLAEIDENEDNRYDQRNIDELAESIQVVGLQQPLVVQANEMCIRDRNTCYRGDARFWPDPVCGCHAPTAICV